MSSCKREDNGKYSVGVVIKNYSNGELVEKKFVDRKAQFILEIEADHESINYGKLLIDKALN